MSKTGEKVTREDHAFNIRQFMESHVLNDEEDGFVVRDVEKAKLLDERFDAQVCEFTRGKMTKVIEDSGLAEDMHDLESDMSDIEFGERFGDSSHMGSMLEFEDDEEPIMPDEDDGTDPDMVDDELSSLLKGDDEGEEGEEGEDDLGDIPMDGEEPMGDIEDEEAEDVGERLI